MIEKYRMQCSEDEIERMSKGPFWQDAVAVINGRLAQLAEALTSPDKTPSLETVRSIQGARATLLQFRELPSLMKAAVKEQKEKDEDGERGNTNE